MSLTMESKGSPAVEEEQIQAQYEQLQTWIENEFDYERPRRGQVRNAIILDIGENDMVVSMGGKRDGIVPRQDLDLLDESYRKSLQVGDQVPIVILGSEESSEEILVSINRGLRQQEWLQAEELLESGEIVEATVTDLNRGGVIVSFGQLNGFVPNSHLDSIPQGLSGKQLQEAKENLIGHELSLAVVEVEQHRRRLLLSERKAKRYRRRQLLKELSEGDVRTGVVTNVVEFGAFVDLGGLDGLIHISELDWGHVGHPRDVVSVGDEIEVYVMSIDRQKKRIALSRKRLVPDPWQKISEEMHPGQTVEGIVTNIADFGVFVDIGRSVEGLVHVSEMPAGEATLAMLQLGARVSMRVLEVDAERRRIALSMRGISPSVSLPVPPALWEQLSEDRDEEADAKSA